MNLSENGLTFLSRMCIACCLAFQAFRLRSSCFNQCYDQSNVRLCDLVRCVSAALLSRGCLSPTATLNLSSTSVKYNWFIATFVLEKTFLSCGGHLWIGNNSKCQSGVDVYPGINLWKFQLYLAAGSFILLTMQTNKRLIVININQWVRVVEWKLLQN